MPRPITAPRGTPVTCKHGLIDAAYRMLRGEARRRETSVHAVAAEVVAQSWRVDREHAEQPISDQAAVPDQRGVPADEPETYRAG